MAQRRKNPKASRSIHGMRQRRCLQLEECEPRHLLASLHELPLDQPVCENFPQSSSLLVSVELSCDQVALPETIPPAVAEAARDVLLNGVSQIDRVGSPGQIGLFDPPGASVDEGTFSIIHDGDYRPIVAGAVWGSGKIVAFGHNGYTDFSNAGNNLDTGQFYKNSLEWLSGTTNQTINIVTDSSGTRSWLLSQGFTNVTQRGDWENVLGAADVLVTELGRNVSTAKQNAVSSFVQNGGGLVTGGTGWGYKQLGADLPTMDGNVILRNAGIVWADGFRDGTTNATNRSSEFGNATTALDFAQQVWNGGAGSQNQRNEAGQALKAVQTALPADHPLMVQLSAAFTSRAGQVSATPATPVSDVLDQAVLTWESNQLQATPVTDVEAHHTATAVYGEIPANAPRVTETVELDTSRSRWHATGLYAAPGEVVTVTVPASFVGRGFEIRLGAHTDDISPRDDWFRLPVVHRSYEINQVNVQVASAFGGALFLDVGSTAPELGIASITIEGAVEAPYFKLGTHTNEQWNATLRDRPAPYGVFESNGVIIVLPKHQIESADLTQAEELVSWWNEAVVLQDDLAAQTNFRTSAELINVDVQNSAGAAHAGFPIQAYERFWGNLADWDDLRVNGSWGDFHELGHNHQRGWWTFSGDGEVSVNIFSNYAMEQLASPEASGFWTFSMDPVATIQTAINDVQEGGSYSSKSDRWSFWFQLADGFGWETYREVFAGYEADAASSPGDLPGNDAEEKDQWFQRWSNQVGYDMTNFMVNTWGLAVSPSVQNAVASLPDWMPLATNVGDFQVEPNANRILNLADGGLGMDGVATFDGIVTQPTLGTLQANGDGTHTYLPNSAGTDSFVIRYRSSAGNVQDFEVSVMIGNGFVPGDIDLDGDLDTDDLVAFIAGWGTDTSNMTDEERIMSGDLNLDGTTNLADFGILRNAWNAQNSATPFRKAWNSATSNGTIRRSTNSEDNSDSSRRDELGWQPISIQRFQR